MKRQRRDRKISEQFKSAIENEGLGHNFENSKWIKPDRKIAKDFARDLVFEDGRSSVWHTSIRDFGDLGEGIALYFLFIRYLALMFLVQAIILIPTMYLYISGEGIPTQTLDPMHLARTTLGNMYSYSINDVLTHYNNTNNTDRYIDDLSSFTQYGQSRIVSLLDVVCTIFTIAFFIKLRSRVQEFVRNVDRDYASPPDYAVFVQGFPIDATVADIREHFSKLYQLSEPDVSWVNGLGTHLTQKPRPVPDYIYCTDSTLGVTEKGFMPIQAEETIPMIKDSVDSWVWEVSIAQVQAEKIKTAKALHKIRLLILRYRAAVKRRASENNTGMVLKNSHEILRLEKKLAQLEVSLHQSVLQNKTYRNGLAAFVLFKYRESRDRCVADYSRTNGLYSHLQPEPLRFRRKHILHVRIPPDPSDIKWRNVGLPEFESYYRQTCAMLLTTVLIAGCFILVLWFRSVFQIYQRSLPDLSLCRIDLPATYARTYDAVDTNFVLEINDTLSEKCGDPDQVWVAYSYLADLNEKHFQENDTCLSPCTFYPGMNPNGSDTCYTLSVEEGCLSMAEPLTDGNINAVCKAAHYDENAIPTMGISDIVMSDVTNLAMLIRSMDSIHCCQEYKKSSTVFSCYCAESLSSNLRTQGIFATIFGIGTLSPECAEYVHNYVMSQGVIILQALMVVLVNAIIRAVVGVLTNLEQHMSESERELSVTKKVFLAQFLNTAVMLLVINADWPTGAVKIDAIDSTGIFQGQYSDFTRSWYLVVGTSIIITMMCNIVSPQLVPLLRIVVIDPVLRLWHSYVAVTQAQLNKAYVGMKFDIAIRYACVLNTVAVTLLYSANLPVVVPLSVVSLMITYSFDKYLLLRVSPIPPAFDASIPLYALKVIPWALAGHCGIAFWSFGNVNLMPSQPVFAGPWIENSNSTFVQSFTYYLNNVDSIGVLARANRDCAMPQFFMAIGCILYLIYSHVSTVRKFVLLTLRVLCKCSCMRCRHVPKVLPHEASMNIIENPPYSQSFVKLNPERDPLDKGNEGKYSYTRWPTNGEMLGVKHRAGSIIKTWEEIQRNGLCSYKIEVNRKFHQYVRVQRIHDSRTIETRSLPSSTAIGANHINGVKSPSRKKSSTFDYLSDDGEEEEDTTELVSNESKKRIQPVNSFKFK